MRMHPDELGGPGVRLDDDEEGMGTAPDPLPLRGRTVMWIGCVFLCAVVVAAWATGGSLFAIGFGLGSASGMVIVAFAVKSDSHRSLYE